MTTSRSGRLVRSRQAHSIAFVMYSARVLITFVYAHHHPMALSLSYINEHRLSLARTRLATRQLRARRSERAHTQQKYTPIKTKLGYFNET